MTLNKKGLVAPMIVIVVIIAAILYMAVISSSLQETRGLETVQRYKMAFNAAETGINIVAARLISAPFYRRWYVRAIGESGGSLEQRLKKMASAHVMPAPGEVTPWSRFGTYQVTIVENSKPQENVLTPPGNPEEADIVKDMYSQAKLSHIDLYSIGTWKDPVTRRESTCLYYGKFIIIPEPFLYEYDTNNDGIITYNGAGTGDEGEAQKDFFRSTGNDLIDHPFHDPDIWKYYTPKDPDHNMQNISPAPVFARVIKRAAWHDTIDYEWEGEKHSVPISQLDLTKPEDRKQVKLALAGINVEYLAHFAAAREALKEFADKETTSDLMGDVVTQAQMEGLVHGLESVPVYPPSDGGPKFKLNKNQWMVNATVHYRLRDDLKPYNDHKFILGVDPLGEGDPTAKYLGSVFQLDKASLDTTVVDKIASGEVKTAEDLYKLMKLDMNADPKQFCLNCSNAVQEYAVVNYPRGKLHVEEKVVDGPNVDIGLKVDENGTGGGKWDYHLDDYFEQQIKAGASTGTPSPDQLYQEMMTEMNEIKTKAHGEISVKLSPRGADLEKGINKIPIILTDNQAVEFTVPYEYVTNYYYKHIDFNYQGLPEDNYDFDPEMPTITPNLTAKWKYICHHHSLHSDKAYVNQPPSYTSQAMAVSP